MPDGGMSVAKDIASIGGAAASVAGTAASFFNKPDMKAPDMTALTEAANREASAARAERERIEAEEAAKKRLRMSGNMGSRSLFSNGEMGYTATLGGP